MPITVKCKCGKGFKVKDHLAGKAVKCPGCGGPLRIPGTPVAAGKSAAPSGAGKSGAEDALLRFEEVQRKKQLSAEEEAAFQAEKNKLIESYDQLTGRTGKEKKKKSELAEAGVKKKPGIFAKIADAFGSMAGTLVFKYILITVLFSGGVVGSVFLVKYITGYMSEESSAHQKPRDERIKDLMQEAEQLIADKQCAEARAKLNEVFRLDRTKEMNRDYQALVKAADDCLARQKP